MKKQVGFCFAHLLFILKLKNANLVAKSRVKNLPKTNATQMTVLNAAKKLHWRCSYKCSPSVSGRTKTTLTINNFEKGRDGGAPSECDGEYHSNNMPVVALSTGWFNNLKRCHKSITIHANGRSVGG
ncbi:unnamed protein product [Camellia sinensis]